MMRVAVVMPAFNEAAGIRGFIAELDRALRSYEPLFVVVDDCSQDATADVARSMVADGIAVEVVANALNVGHGPSTVRALHRGLESGADVVVAVDGDGQFLGADVRTLVEVLLSPGVDCAEGARARPDDPVYRRAVSLVTRLLVFTKARTLPADANTPLRGYRPETLECLLAAVPVTAATPNLLISALTRRWQLTVVEVPVRSIPRRGGTEASTTWGRSRRGLPSRRFTRFCVNAAREWVGTPLAPVPPNLPTSGAGDRG